MPFLHPLITSLVNIAPPDLNIKHHFSSGVYIKQMRLPKAHYAETHEHKYDHFGLLGSGSASVEIDGAKHTYEGPCVIEIKAGAKHKITALTDITWFCIHATNETDIKKIDQVLIKED
jgi:quercetin dioxygenase-like cupin family protein